MSENSKFEIIDILVVLVKRKFLFLFTALLIGAITYFSLLFFVEEKFEASATIIPSETGQMSGFSSILKNLPSMPFSLGGGAMKSQIELYATIIYSRTMLEKVLDKFDLQKAYGSESREKALKELKENISSKNDEDVAFIISATSNSPQLSADIANFIVDELNLTVIELNIQKARENREFLEKRYHEIQTGLKFAEDSMMFFQQRTGVIQAEDQIKATITLFSNLEADLVKRQVELAVAEKSFGENSPQVDNIRYSVRELEKKIDEMKKGQSSSLTLAIQNIPANAVSYFRHFRDVEILTAMLEFVLPMYEQSKFEEQKNMPVIQVIDRAVAPEKKSWPPRSFYTIVVVFSALGLLLLLVMFSENPSWSKSPKVQYIKENLFSFKRSKFNQED
ncbi:MAG: hypothetical protein IAE91_03850 [Ignavibacteriaceae bacterium]|nr:hypothetical protein [Ignavibacteriaceae bacterium]